MTRREIAINAASPDLKDAIQVMYENFDHYNEKHFGNRLKEPIISIVKNALIEKHTVDDKYYLGEADTEEIYLIEELFTYTPNHYDYRLACGVLLHEMIHYSGIMNHGLKFACECNRIGKAEGLKPVNVQNCESWTGVDNHWIWSSVQDQTFIKKQARNEKIFDHRKAVLNKFDTLKTKIENIKSKSTKRAFSEFHTELDNYFTFLIKEVFA